MSKTATKPECIRNMKDEISLPTTEKKDTSLGLLSRLLRLDPLNKKTNSVESHTPAEPQTIYYGVYIPCEIKKGQDEEALLVYTKKAEALELVRRYKLARFKAFSNRQDAISFTLREAETDGNEGFNSVGGEKPYPFKAPSPQEMVVLRKAIEAGLSTIVRDRVWDNPRYLVSNGSTPVIMQEGARYNALHVAAKAGNADICNLILTTVGNPAFIQTLYGTDADPDSCKDFSSILVDRYLNTPDKSMNETPLHFACKFGSEPVVDVLTSFPQCNIDAKNKFGEMPKDIICKRASSSTAETASRIASLLRARYYVPVLHVEDDSELPRIGSAFTPSRQPNINTDPLSPRYEILAYAGPMEPQEAEQFRRRWKTPPRDKINFKSPAFRLKEPAKGLETQGRSLAEQLKVGWKEYWPFLDTFTDLRSKEGLELLENYLKKKYEAAISFAYSESCMETHHSITPDDLSISRITLNILQSSPIKETTMSPITELCFAMRSCSIKDRAGRLTRPAFRDRIALEHSKPIANGDSGPAINHTVSQLLCIERTCQVFAKRIADALNFSLTAEPDVAGESLKAEAEHLQHTIFTYKVDERFQNINFALIHSRLAQLVIYKLKQQTKELDDINGLIEFLVKLRCPNDDIFSSDDERKPSVFRGPNRLKLTHVINSHVRCLASFICEELTESDAAKGPSMSESECGEVWEKASKCRCDWTVDLFERNSKKNASFRKNRSILSTSPKSESFIRRISFDDDIGDGKLQRNVSEKPTSVNSPAGDSRPPEPDDKTSESKRDDDVTKPKSPATTVFTVDTTKCQVVEAEISDDESVASCVSDADSFVSCCDSAVDCVDGLDGEDVMQDADNKAVAEPFIYGDEPTKMDRLVWDAVSSLELTPEVYPSIYRWRHTVSLYPEKEREMWKAAHNLDESSTSSLIGTPVRFRVARHKCSTPQKELSVSAKEDRGVPLQCLCKYNSQALIQRSPLCSKWAWHHTSKLPPEAYPEGSRLQHRLFIQYERASVSNWLRVTGPNSPRSALATKNIGHNVSFGY